MPPPTSTTSGFALSGTTPLSEVTSVSPAVQEMRRGAVLLIVGRSGLLHAVRRM
jgi:hypothetical protein